MQEVFENFFDFFFAFSNMKRVDLMVRLCYNEITFKNLRFIMKLFAPAYYKRFTCIADKCRHSCCIGWEIDVDTDTLQIYAGMIEGYGQKIQESIDITETPHFRLAANERCPHLNERGLCNIILSCGEQYLCDICREHPRFYNDTPCGREVGLGMACEEACRLILCSDDYADMIEWEELDGQVEGEIFDSLSNRARLYTILSDERLPYTDRLRLIRQAYAVEPGDTTDIVWRERLAALEYLNEQHKHLFAAYSSDITTPQTAEKVLERALAYFIYRHCTEVANEVDYRAKLGFCLFCERLLASMIRTFRATSATEIIELARVLSEEIEYSEDNTEALTEHFYY